MYALAARCIALLYGALALLPLQNKITLLSRQGREPSLDFSMLAERLNEGCQQGECGTLSTKDEIFSFVIRTVAVEPENKSGLAFLLSFPKMIYHVATSRVLVLEGYIPAVSIPHLRKGTCVIQMWHALGAIKKFGFQSVGTDAGRSKKASEALRMHANYDWIIAAGPGSVSAYTEAFGYEPERILPLGMPRMDYLSGRLRGAVREEQMRTIKKENAFLADCRRKVLYAPTLRRGKQGWMVGEVEKLATALVGDLDAVLIVAGHPLEKERATDSFKHSEDVFCLPGKRSIDILGLVDDVITDYSALAFEAALIGKPVWFYVPDIERYRKSPGLNVDPLLEFPTITFCDPNLLSSAMAKHRGLPSDLEDGVERALPNKRKPSAHDAFQVYCQGYFGEINGGSTDKLVAFIQKCYRETLRDCDMRPHWSQH